MPSLTSHREQATQGAAPTASQLSAHLDRISRIDSEFVVFDDGYRGWTYSYRAMAEMAWACASRLRAEGIHKGEKVLIWSENRPGWIAALWGCLLEGVIVVPVDQQSSPVFLERIRNKVRPRAILVGERVPPLTNANGVPIWRLTELEHDRRPDPPVALGPLSGDDLAEIVFTSGTTAEPKGVIITQRNLSGSLKPIEDQIAPYLKYVRPFAPLRFLNLLPMSHLFGQALALFLPPLIPASAVFVSSVSAQEIARQIRARGICTVVAVPKILEVLRDFVIHRFPEAAAAMPESAPRQAAESTLSSKDEAAVLQHDMSAQDAAASLLHQNALPWRSVVRVPESAQDDAVSSLHQNVLPRRSVVRAPESPWKDPWPLRWWRFRNVHGLFGWKFCSFFVGGAPLASDLEQFWTNLGYLVVQGYGLTETAPIMTFSHPFHVRHGTAGKPLEGVDVRIAPDGEVLVRGDIVTPGYFESPEQTAAAFKEGWFHTGDIGELDAAGHLIIRGRKKEMIATPEGLKVFPEDVENVLNQIPGVQDSAVIGKDQVNAVLVLAPGANANDIVRRANERLEPHQRIRSVSVWSEGNLPRTATTRKLRHAEIAERVIRNFGKPEARRDAGVTELVQRFAPGREISPQTTLEELGLSSLDRVELMMDLEKKLDTSIDESAFARVSTVADLAKPMEPEAPTPFPRYNRAFAARLIRRVSLAAILLPLTRFFARAKVSGVENLRGLRGPVIFASNHQSYIDTPLILASLPVRWRYRIAPAMWKEYFDAHFSPRRYSRRQYWGNTLLYRLITALFNAYPMPQTEAGARESIRYTGELVEDGWSILIFPEGERTESGEMHPFLPGVGLLASHLHLPVVPIRLNGAHRVWHRTKMFPRPGRVEVSIGSPLWLEGEPYPALARKLESTIAQMNQFGPARVN